MSGSFQELPSKTYELRPNREKTIPCKVLRVKPPQKDQDLEMGTGVLFSIGRKQFVEVGAGSSETGKSPRRGPPKPSGGVGCFPRCSRKLLEGLRYRVIRLMHRKDCSDWQHGERLCEWRWRCGREGENIPE